MRCRRAVRQRSSMRESAGGIGSAGRRDFYVSDDYAADRRKHRRQWAVWAIYAGCEHCDRRAMSECRHRIGKIGRIGCSGQPPIPRAPAHLEPTGHERHDPSRAQPALSVAWCSLCRLADVCVVLRHDLYHPDSDGSGPDSLDGATCDGADPLPRRPVPSRRRSTVHLAAGRTKRVTTRGRLLRRRRRPREGLGRRGTSARGGHVGYGLLRIAHPQKDRSPLVPRQTLSGRRRFIPNRWPTADPLALTCPLERHRFRRVKLAGSRFGDDVTVCQDRADYSWESSAGWSSSWPALPRRRGF